MGGSKSSSKVSMMDILTKEQLALLNQMSGFLGDIFGTSAEVYGEELIPGASGLQQSAFDQIQSSMGPGSSVYEQIQNFIKTGGVDPKQREKVYAAGKDLAMREFGDFSRQASESYNAQGAGRSGGLQRSLGHGAARMGQNLAQMYSQLEYQDDTRRNQGIMQGLQAFGNQQGMALESGAQQRAITAQQGGEQYQKWLAAQPYANPWLQYIPQVFGTQAQTPVTTSRRSGGGIFTGG